MNSYVLLAVLCARCGAQMPPYTRTAFQCHYSWQPVPLGLAVAEKNLRSWPVGRYWYMYCIRYRYTSSAGTFWALSAAELFGVQAKLIATGGTLTSPWTSAWIPHKCWTWKICAQGCKPSSVCASDPRCKQHDAEESTSNTRLTEHESRLCYLHCVPLGELILYISFLSIFKNNIKMQHKQIYIILNSIWSCTTVHSTVTQNIWQTHPKY